MTRALTLLAVLVAGCAGGAASSAHGGSASGSGGGQATGSSGVGGSASSNDGGDASDDGSTEDGGDGGLVVSGCDASAPPTRFISCVVSFKPGAGAGFGQNKFPEIIYGPPLGGGATAGSLDVLSLGGGGEIVFGFGGNAIVDGPGADFIVFENPFDVDGDAMDPYAEPGVVGVSEDGVTWVEFPCHDAGYPYSGCAGWHPVYSNPDNDISPFDVSKAGGDAFDLADVGLSRARFVRIRDVSFHGGPPSEGFDLDATAIVNAEHP